VSLRSRKNPPLLLPGLCRFSSARSFAPVPIKYWYFDAECSLRVSPFGGLSRSLSLTSLDLDRHERSAYPSNTAHRILVCPTNRLLASPQFVSNFPVDVFLSHFCLVLV
jgi:hypothetical protein